MVGALTNSGSLTDQYRLIFPSLASPFLPPRREMPPCGGREGGGAPPLDCLLGSSPRHDGDFGWRNVVFFALCIMLLVRKSCVVCKCLWGS